MWNKYARGGGKHLNHVNGADEERTGVAMEKAGREY